MTQLTNKHNVDLLLAVWLADSNYDHSEEANFYHLSVTALAGSVRQIILSYRALSSIVTEGQLPDVLDQLAVRIGQNVHTGIEDAWTKRLVQNLNKLDVPQTLLENIEINNEASTKPFKLLFEQRYDKKLLDFTISGGVDLIFLNEDEGQVNDFKTSGVYGYIKGTNTLKYQKQLSRYRWLRPDLITEDIGKLHYIFKDWKAGEAAYKENYPAFPVFTEDIVLDSVQETERELTEKLLALLQYKDSPETQLPACTSFELGIGTPTYKYFKNPTATGKSTRTSTNYTEIKERYIKDGSVGRIETIKDKPFTCTYCAASGICSQFKNMMEE